METELEALAKTVSEVVASVNGAESEVEVVEGKKQSVQCDQDDHTPAKTITNTVKPRYSAPTCNKFPPFLVYRNIFIVGNKKNPSLEHYFNRSLEMH